MNHTAKELESGAIREIEPEVRTLFTKVVERDPREAARMLEPYPDEFIVQMLELLNPASALKIRGGLCRRMPGPGAYHRTINPATIGSLQSANNGCPGNRTDSASREKNHYHLRLCHRRAGETPGGSLSCATCCWHKAVSASRKSCSTIRSISRRRCRCPKQ